MGTYYRSHILGSDLQRVYELASPRIREYLHAEIESVVERVRGASRVLELGCGYGRLLREVAPQVGRAVGIDVTAANLQSAASYLSAQHNCDLLLMDAVRLAFADGRFDATVCAQNGICAFGVDRSKLVSEAVRVTREGGQVLFSTYSPEIWADRLEWFRAQAQAGLIGPIDESQSKDGTIVCRDGLRLATASADEFRDLFTRAGQRARIREVDHSSVFAEAAKGDPS